MIHLARLPWHTLQCWSAPAFGFAGLLWLGDALLLGLEALQIYAHGLLNGVLIAGAMFATSIGLLGLVPAIAPDHPLLGRMNALLAAVSAVTMAVVIGWQLLALAADGVGLPPGFTAVMVPVALVSVGLSASLTAAPSRVVGALLLGLAAPWLWLLGLALLGPPAWLQSPAPWQIGVTVGGFAALSQAVGYAVQGDLAADVFDEYPSPEITARHP
jgi:hypothetical protein